MAGVTAALGACNSIAPPDWSRPGPAFAQQNRAEQFDPFPSPDIGPDAPETRPPNFTQPLPEPVRAQQRPKAIAPR
jgi:hypothetical protein